MKRVLKYGGLFILVEIIREYTSLQQKNYVEMHHWWSEVDRLEDIPHFPTQTRAEVADHFMQLDMKQVEQFTHDYPVEDNDTKLLEELDEVFEFYYEKIRKFPGHENLISKGKKIKKSIKKTGLKLPTVLFLLGRK